MRSVRPTLRALLHDLRLPFPPVNEALDDLDHPLLAKARAQFAAPGIGHERIRAIDDEVLWKVRSSAGVAPSGPKRTSPGWSLLAADKATRALSS